MEDLLAYLKARDATHDRERWLTQRAYANPDHPDFLLNPRTKRLGPAPNVDSKLAGRPPWAVFLALPDPPFSEVVDTSQDEIWTWLSDRGSRCYQPDPDTIFLRGTVKAALDGIIIGEPASENNSRLRTYVAIERIGAIEMGLGDVLYKLLDGYVVFRFTALIGYLWQFLGFVTDFYRTFGQDKPFTLFIGIRATEGTLLGGLAKGWKEPFPYPDHRPLCPEPGICFCRDHLGPVISPESVADLVREVATRIDNAWGERRPRCYAMAQTDPEQKIDVDQFHQLTWR